MAGLELSSGGRWRESLCVMLGHSLSGRRRGLVRPGMHGYKVRRHSTCGGSFGARAAWDVLRFSTEPILPYQLTMSIAPGLES